MKPAKAKCLLFVAVLLIVSCTTTNGNKYSEPSVKPENSRKSINKPESVDVSSQTHSLASLPYHKPVDISKLSDEEIYQLKKRCYYHVSMVLHACEWYHDTYFKYPSDLSELLDGFMPFWPGNVYSGGYTQILHDPPDLSKPEYLGQIYYLRNSDHDASIIYLTLMEESSGIKPEFRVIEEKLVSSSAAYFSDIAGNENSIRGHFTDQLMEMSENERFVYNFRMNVVQALIDMTNDSLWRKRTLDSNFTSLLDEGQFYFLESGLETLKRTVSEGNLYFEMGKYDDGVNFYQICGDPKSTLKPECKKFDPLKGKFGQIVAFIDCPEGSKRQSVFSVSDLKNLSISDKLLITKEELKYLKTTE
jgi:hypothetical protein